MKKLFKNWKTTFLGFSTIIGGVALIVKGSAYEGIFVILNGFGLVQAKDHDQN
jgi:hypothetical protein